MTAEPSAITCTGPVNRSSLGFTLPHEHILINQMKEYRSTGLINDVETCANELELFKGIGGRTVVDVTTAELTAGAAPDPTGIYSGVRGTGYPMDGSRATSNVLAIVELAQRTGLNVILGTGHYRDPYLDQNYFDRQSVDVIAKAMIRDLTDGFPETRGVRAGVIGEIGSDAWHISGREERSFRAAARASCATNAPITTHAARWPVGIAQLDLLEDEGVPPSRVIIGHADTVHIPEYHLDLARRGAYVQFDAIRFASAGYLRRRAEYLRALRDAGFVRQILVSHDVCEASHQRANGGCGFTLIGSEFASTLRESGFSDDELSLIFEENPSTVLSWA